jgi:hypothetical protein
MAEEKLTLKTYLESSQFVKGAAKIKKSLSGISSVASKFGATLSTVMAVQTVKAMVTMAGEAEKTDLRFKRVFGSMSSEVTMFSSSLSTDLGRVKSDIESGMVSFQAFFQGLGFGGQEAIKMSSSMQALSLDLASFFQLQDGNAQKRFLAALAGSPEVLDQFGINLKEARLEQELLNMGITTTVQKTDEMTKTHARLSVIMKAMTANGIVGDARRTMFTYANTLTRAEGSLKELAISIGDKFIPFAKEMLEVVISVSNGINKLFGGGTKLSKLNEEQQKQFQLLGAALIASEKGASDYELILNKLVLMYPKFLKGLDRATVSTEELEKRVSEINGAFETQQKIVDNGIKIQELKVDLTEKENRVLALKEEIQKNIANGEKRNRDGEVERNERLKEQLTGSIRGTNATLDLAAATKEYSDAVAENVRLLALRDVVFEDTFGGKKKEEEKPPRSVPLAPSFGNLGSSMQMIDSMAIAGDMSEELKKIPENIEPISMRWEDVFSLDGIEFTRTALLEDGKLITNTFVDWSATISNALLGLASNISSAFGSAVQQTLSGGADFGTAVRLATKSALGAMAADLAAKALYYGILATGFGAAAFATAGLSVPMGVSAGTAAAIFGAGAVALGAASSVISGKGGASGSMSSSGTGGDANNRGGIGGGTFEDFMNSIRGEQVFRLAGNDLVTAINRTDTFQGSIGG